MGLLVPHLVRRVSQLAAQPIQQLYGGDQTEVRVADHDLHTGGERLADFLYKFCLVLFQQVLVVTGDP